MESTWWNACYVVVSRRWVYHFKLLLCPLLVSSKAFIPLSFPCAAQNSRYPCLVDPTQPLTAEKPYLVHPLGELLALQLFHYRPQTLQSSSRKSFKYSTIVSRGLKRECRIIWSCKMNNPWHSNGTSVLFILQVRTKFGVLFWGLVLWLEHAHRLHTYSSALLLTVLQPNRQLGPSHKWQNDENGNNPSAHVLYGIYYNLFTHYWPSIVQIYVRTRDSNPMFTCPRPTTWKEGNLQKKKKK